MVSDDDTKLLLKYFASLLLRSLFVKFKIEFFVAIFFIYTKLFFLTCYLVKGLWYNKEKRAKYLQKVKLTMLFLTLVHVFFFRQLFVFQFCRLLLASSDLRTENWMEISRFRRFLKFHIFSCSICCCCCCWHQFFHPFVRIPLADIGGANFKIINILIHSEYKLMALFAEFKSFFCFYSLDSLRNLKIVRNLLYQLFFCSRWTPRRFVWV